MNYASITEYGEPAKAVNWSVTNLQDALFSQDAAAAKAALAKVKVPYSKFFLKFGYSSGQCPLCA